MHNPSGWPRQPFFSASARTPLAVAVSLATLFAAPHAFGVDPSGGLDKVRCSVQSPAPDIRRIECAIERHDPPGIKLTANFSGGHDDTMASLTATLNGAPMTCAPGSKTSLMGEDGDVSLHCKVALPATPATRSLLQVDVKWHHAEYTGFELSSD